MKTIRMFQVDSFTDRLFSGNPAAVCLLDKWPAVETMQAVAAENNLAETAFVIPQGEEYAIRWFTPTVEVDLCGHATLAAGYVLFEKLGFAGQEIVFHSLYSGILKVFRDQGKLFLDFPVDRLAPSDCAAEIAAAIGTEVLEAFRGRGDLLALLASEEEVLNLKPDMARIAALDARGLVVTAAGKEVDFVSRFFAPQSGIPEDPVTGSAHTTLLPLWAGKTGKTRFRARQLSKRGGELECILKGDRCLIGGKARLFLEGQILLEE
ncbi:MAG: PhzF family phenazine biosynthesis protein [Bacteroidota bacterium]